MVRLPRSQYEAHPQVRYQDCSLYSSLRRSLSLRSSLIPKRPFFTTRPDHPKFDRRRGFSNRATVTMAVATVINFVLSTLNTGSQVATFIMFIRKGLILDIGYPLSEKQELVNNASRNMNIVGLWAQSIPVSGKLSLSDPVLIHPRWRCGSATSLSFGGLGPSSKINSG